MAHWDSRVPWCRATHIQCLVHTLWERPWCVVATPAFQPSSPIAHNASATSHFAPSSPLFQWVCGVLLTSPLQSPHCTRQRPRSVLAESSHDEEQPGKGRYVIQCLASVVLYVIQCLASVVLSFVHASIAQALTLHNTDVSSTWVMRSKSCISR